MRAAVIPDWLTELMRLKPAPLPWRGLPGSLSGVVGLAGFEPAASATQNCYEPRTRMLALH